MNKRWTGCFTGLAVVLGAGGCITTEELAGTTDVDTAVAGATELLAEGLGSGLGSGQIGARGGFSPVDRLGELSDAQVAELEALRARVESGELSREEAFEQVREIVGEDFGPAGRGFGAFPGVQADPLELTDEQAAQAEELRAAARADFEAIRDGAREDVRALLTDEQVAILDERTAEREGFADRPRGARRGGFGPGAGVGRGPLGAGGFGGPDEDRMGAFAELLELTEEQQDQIAVIREDAQLAAETRREQASEEFRAILTEEQIATLDELEAAGFHGRF